MRSRRAAIAASLAGALLIAGVPTLAFGEADGTHEAKAYTATAASDDMAAQKAKDEDEKKDGDKKDAKKGGDEKKAAEKKKDKKADDNKKADEKKAADKKKADDDRKGAEKRKNDDDRKSADKKKDDGDRKRHDNDGKKDDGKKNNGNKDADKKKKQDDDKWASDRRDDWRNKKHDDKWDRDWDHDRDRHHRRHYWDTHRRYYRYGYYGPGYYDDCGYYGPYYYGYDDDDTGYRGYDDRYYQGAYYGPDACGYEYGGYRSHMLVDMSWDQVIPDRNAGGYPARNAYGTANLDIDVPAGTICFRLAYDGIDRATGAQIHPGRMGEVGPSLVLFHVGQNGDDGCIGADPGLLSEIQNNPSGYYLEVNDEEHGQALRGQLDAPDYRSRY
jgi:CHRD domain-containing protein